MADGRPVPVELFHQCVDRWLAAFRSGRLEEALRAREELGVVGAMLTNDPEFRVLFRRICGPGEPDDPTRALHQMCLLLEAVTQTAVPGAYRSGRI